MKLRGSGGEGQDIRPAGSIQRRTDPPNPELSWPRVGISGKDGTGVGEAPSSGLRSATVDGEAGAMTTRRGEMGRWLEALDGDGTAAGLGDGELLRRFLSAPGASSEAAFEVIVRRHGPAVMGVCRGVLRDDHDAEDAFQATFLVLARRAATVRDHGRIAPWLARTARRIALRARKTSARRRAFEGAALDFEVGTVQPPGETLAASEVAEVVRSEVGRFPEPDRTLLRLTYWRGRSYEEAAEAVARPIGTVRSRLARARDRLRERLARRGIGATVVAVRPSGPLIVRTARLAVAKRAATAAGTLPATVAALVEGELAMTTIRRGAFAASLLIGGAATGALALSLSPSHADDAPAPTPITQSQAAKGEEEAKVPLENAGAEEGLNDDPEAWSPGGSVPGVEYSWSREAAHGGKASLALRKTAQRYFPIAEWTQETPRQGEAPRLRVSAWVKADRATKAILDVQFRDDAGKWSHAWVAYIGPINADAPPVSHDWKRYEGVVAIPPRTKTLTIGGQIYGPGEVSFDDFEASYTEAPATDPLATAAK
jgi:RNA polymerase sigma-70 factor (ECF subfamily)